MKVILDAGALIAIDRRDRAIGARLRVLQRDGTPLRTSAAAVAQAWRNGQRQANLARVLAGMGVEPLRRDDGKRVGELLCQAGSADVVDGHVALLVATGDLILTNDPADIRALLRTRAVSASVQQV